MVPIVITDSSQEAVAVGRRLQRLCRGLEVRPASSPAKAVAALRREESRADLVVVDAAGAAREPLKSELEKLRRRDRGGCHPVVGLCGEYSEASAVHGLLTQILRRPVDQKKLKEVVKNYLHRQV